MVTLFSIKFYTIRSGLTKYSIHLQINIHVVETLIHGWPNASQIYIYIYLRYMLADYLLLQEVAHFQFWEKFFSMRANKKKTSSEMKPLHISWNGKNSDIYS